MQPTHVVAIISAKAGQGAELLAAFEAKVPNVHAEVRRLVQAWRSVCAAAFAGWQRDAV